MQKVSDEQLSELIEFYEYNCGNERSRGTDVLAALRELLELRAEIQKLREALGWIANPIEHMRAEAEVAGNKIVGPIAIALAEDSDYLQKIARAALTPSPSKNWMVCPKCGFYLDTPNHELGCAAGEQK